MSAKDTKELILDAAEELFARNGFHGASLRAITQRAGVNLAAVNYHYGSKEALVEEVIKRRIVPLNDQRLQRLQAVRRLAARHGLLPDAGEVLAAFIEPTLTFSRSGPGGMNFTTLIGRALAESDETVMPIFSRYINDLYVLLFTTLCEALPTVAKGVVYWRLHFCLGTLVHTMKMAKQPLKVPPGVEPVDDISELTGLVLDFVTAGMEQTP